ncbi:protein of unknown function DUF448 [Denitrovibrio acetiphilus DSM 12809]|uniref:YlxR domain-containing protein n=1 Tax=Denitrovibrio acetiphilus (strain DSM 12809 / NBRC 114555 / N2460) TaxID=522772 RepID=D4H7W8_DENA2|nr:YlxR family protein [Denitrovibrio acetiphilus]ADD68117.1 protein of unknown function DUF448 [Denitrovibrio acetiphilus DSM 12809]
MTNTGAKTPLRTCVACGTKKPKSKLLRFVLEQGICMDERQIRHGRGAYVCMDEKCRETGIEKKKLQRSLHKVTRRNRKTG